ncbi:Uncharacterised protein [Vibrio cholerae]|nr:Uncharacterised protein [Vibrio cholerae]CSI60912.1 Uncharacterised protein [Vibrio cholerae]
MASHNRNNHEQREQQIVGATRSSLSQHRYPLCNVIALPARALHQHSASGNRLLNGCSYLSCLGKQEPLDTLG